MDKDQYLLNILTKTKHKKYEHFVVSRIIHRLCNTDIKIVSQQFVRRKSSWALLDLYFPQINISLEIDEPQHESENHKNLDKIRTRDIISATNLTEIRIKVRSKNGHKTLTELAQLTDEFISCILLKVEEAQNHGRWEPWDFENEFTSKPYLKRGYIDARENVLLRKHTDAIELFGVSLKAHRRGGWTPPEETGLGMVWFPRLYQNAKWDNSLSDDGMIIVEKGLNNAAREQPHKDRPNKENLRAVFARREEPFLGTLYRFLGVFSYDFEVSQKKEANVYYKVKNRIEFKKAD